MTAAIRAIALLACATSALAQTTAIDQAVSLARQGRTDEARALLERGRLQFPTDKRFPIELAGLDYLRKDLPSAAAHLRAALRLDPSDRYATELLASIYQMQGRLEASLALWNRIGQPVLADVRFDPALPLPPALRARAVAFSAGQILTLDRLRATDANLDRLGVFSDWSYDLSPMQDGRFSVALRTTDSSLWSGWKMRLISAAAALPYQTLALTFPNLDGKALNLSSLLRWDPNKRRAAFSLGAPLGERPDLRYRLFLDARDERWNLRGTQLSDVRVRRLDAGADLAIGLSPRLEWTPGIRLSRAAYTSPLEDYWSFRARNQLDFALLRSPEHRLRVDTTASVETGSIWRRTQSRLATVDAGAQAVWGPFSADTAGLVRAGVRAGRIFGDPGIDQLFMLGMERDNDLWLRGHVGTLDGRKGNAPMGRSFALTQLTFERSWLRFPLVDFWAGPFFDTGRVTDSAWLYDTGIQATLAVRAGIEWTFVYGRDLRDGRGVFYSAVRRVKSTRPPR